MNQRIPSASGARISGDDYQHVFTWIHALKLLVEEEGISRIEFEADAAGNVDDLVIHRTDGSALYHQIKFVVTQKEPLTHSWFTTLAGEAKRTSLQRFYDSFKKLTASDGRRPDLAFHTNRWPAAGDPLLTHVSGRRSKLVPYLLKAGKQSESSRVRREWAAHLDVNDEELIEFLEHFEIHAGRADFYELQDQCGWVMGAVGFRRDQTALQSLVGRLRELIGEGVRELSADDVREIGAALDLLAGATRATLLVQAIERDPWPEAATVALDWVDLFQGDTPNERRQLKDPREWNEVLRPELRAAVDRLKRGRHEDIYVHGAMRLSTGLLVGSQLSEVAGFRVAVKSREGEWCSDGDQSGFELERVPSEIGQGDEVAVALAISQDIGQDVIAYLIEKQLPIHQLWVYSPKKGASRKSVADASKGLAAAAQVSSGLRENTRGGTRLHLFQACPLAMSVMVGHLWNRMPATQLYDDLGPGRGYAETFLL